MENHNFLWENPLWMVIFNSYVYLPECIPMTCQRHLARATARARSARSWLLTPREREDVQNIELPSGHQTWLAGKWSISRWSHWNLLKPPFPWDCPLPCLMTRGIQRVSSVVWAVWIHSSWSTPSGMVKAWVYPLAGWREHTRSNIYQINLKVE